MKQHIQPDNWGLPRASRASARTGGFISVAARAPKPGGVAGCAPQVRGVQRLRGGAGGGPEGDVRRAGLGRQRLPVGRGAGGGAAGGSRAVPRHAPRLPLPPGGAPPSFPPHRPLPCCGLGWSAATRQQRGKRSPGRRGITVPLCMCTPLAAPPLILARFKTAERCPAGRCLLRATWAVARCCELRCTRESILALAAQRESW